MARNIALISDPIHAALVAAKVQILMHEPDVGNSLIRLGLLPDETLTVPLMRDGNVLRYNRDLVNRLTPVQLRDLLKAAASSADPSQE